MLLKGIELQNYLAHRHLALPFAPMTIIAGPNGAGKTSVADGIGFALLAELRRVELKGERKALVSDGADKGKVVLRVGDVAVTRDITNGKVSVDGDAPIMPDGVAKGALAYVLNAARFPRLPADERRVLLYQVMGVSADPAAILKTLAERGHTEEVLKPLRDMKDSTVPKWLTLAEKNTTEAKGVWRGITGEAYGTQKAETWAAAAPAATGDDDLAALEERAGEVVMLIGDKQKALGAIEAKMQAATAQAETAAGLRRQVASLPSLRLELATATNRLEQRQAEVDAAIKAKGEVDARAAEAHLVCPRCEGKVMLAGDGLEAYTPPSRPATKTELDSAVDALAGARIALRQAEEAVRAARQAIADAETAEKVLAGVEEIPANELPAQRAATEHELAELKDEQADLQRRLTDLRNGRAAAERAVGTTRKAAEAHLSAQRWAALAAALAPDGIPGELLAKAIGPLNDTLRGLAAGSRWGQVTIGPDMAITAAGRPYGLLSESEQWRADVQLAIGLAVHSGLRLVVLDRFDVLDLPSRRPALAWLFGLTKSQLDSVLVLGTFKEPPKVPAAVTVHWLGEPAASTQAAA